MNKARLFIENFIIYGFGGIISKAIPLIMVPIITRIMPDKTYFGISDMSQAIISFGCALADMGMYDAMYRMFFEKEDENYKKVVCSTTLVFTMITSFVVFVVMLVFQKPMSKFFLGNINLYYIIYISAIATLVNSTNQIISAPTRMQNKRRVFLITNTINPLLSYGIAIPLLLNGYFTIALPVAGVVSGITLEVSFYILNRKWFIPRLFSLKVLKQLLIIGIPLLPNFLIYWIFNSSDRVMITNLIDVGAEGIYSVGSKLGHVSYLIYTAFAGGWQFFAFSTMKEKDQVKSNSLVFEYLGVISFVATSIICSCSYLIYELLFVGEYVDGYAIAPYLFLAPLLQMLFQVACNQFIVIKKTWPNMFILLGGAILNIIINYWLIPIIGIEGAAIATLLGYVASDIIVIIVLKRMNLMIVSSRFLSACVGLLLVFLLWRFTAKNNTLLGLIFSSCYTIFILFMYKNEVKMIKSQIKGRGKTV